VLARQDLRYLLDLDPVTAQIRVADDDRQVLVSLRRADLFDGAACTVERFVARRAVPAV
jgi:hypothetical protein